MTNAIMQITNATPGLKLASLLVGIIVGVALSSWLTGLAVWMGGLVVIDLAFVLLRRSPWHDRFSLIILLAVGLLIGMMRYSLVGQPVIASKDDNLIALMRQQLTIRGQQSIVDFVGTERQIIGTIVAREADVTSQQLTLSNMSLQSGERAPSLLSGRVLVFVPGYPLVKTGDIVQFSCRLEAPEPFEGFSYDRYLATKDIYATCFTREVPFVLKESDRFVALDRLHESVVGVIERTFGEPQAALLSGLLMGDDKFSDEWKERFLRTGTSHVVAASGYNVSMLAFVMLAILISLGFKRQQAFPIILVGIACFVSIAGAGGAVTRAGIMGALALTATQLGRKTTSRNIILLTVVVMLLDEPRLLRDDVGFQLSVLSTVGLVTMARYFSEKFQFIPKVLGLRESFAATVAATLATLPIVLFGFGKISIISPFVNLLVLPFVPYAMLTGAIATVVGAIDSSLGALVGGPAWLFLTAMLEIIQAMAALPFAIVNL